MRTGSTPHDAARRPALAVVFIPALLLAGTPAAAPAQERQLTSTPKNHNLDNNDNFSRNGRYLCYDTRGMLAFGIGNCRSIEMVDVKTGEESLIYAAPDLITREDEFQSAPGVGAASFSPVAFKVAFIHGPFLSDTAERGFYGKPNRCGAEVAADGAQRLTWLDHRDIARGRDTLPGAHRGGTHRHEYAPDGWRIGFTYDDFLLPQYDRTVGYMESHAKAPGGATHYFAVLVPVVPKGTAQPGQIEKAWGDSWVGRDGTRRAFIGNVREKDGSYIQSLFVVEVPATVDITTADSGGSDRYPAPPKGTSVRRITHAFAEGVVRGAPDGKRIAYYTKPDGGDVMQVAVVSTDGSDRAPEPALRPRQVTNIPGGVECGLRWHPSGDWLVFIAGNRVTAACVQEGPHFGELAFLTEADGPPRTNLVVAPDGTTLAYNKPVPTLDAQGERATNYDGSDCLQIFTLAWTPPPLS